MSLETRFYTRKPLEVEAIQVTFDNFEEVAEWCRGSIRNIDGSSFNGDVDPHRQFIHVRVYNPRNARQSKAYIGDWILYTDQSYKIYNTKAFLGSFDVKK